MKSLTRTETDVVIRDLTRKLSDTRNQFNIGTLVRLEALVRQRRCMEQDRFVRANFGVVVPFRRAQ